MIAERNQMLPAQKTSGLYESNSSTPHGFVAADPA
jgi:hypothetical protein